MTPAAKLTLQQAAAASHKTVSEFLLDSGLSAAQDALADRRVFQLSEAKWTAFLQALASPPEENPGLRDLLSRKPDWA
jgi:uncharacterized protein (DUF1778 family)